MKTRFIAGIALAFAATAAVAQMPQAGRGDGVQTRQEAVQRVQQMFARADTNRDGFLTQAEVQSGRQSLRQRGSRAQRAVDPARRAERAFARFDLNRDGVISRQEFAQRQALRGERAQRGERGQRGQRMAGMRGGLGGRMFALADLNRDNRLSVQEATGAALQRFDRTDLNRDGRVTRDERLQARAQRQNPRRG
jgi:Ca2+-binding EF-hand superfamily protein